MHAYALPSIRILHGMIIGIRQKSRMKLFFVMVVFCSPASISAYTTSTIDASTTTTTPESAEIIGSSVSTMANSNETLESAEATTVESAEVVTIESAEVTTTVESAEVTDGTSTDASSASTESEATTTGAFVICINGAIMTVDGKGCYCPNNGTWDGTQCISITTEAPSTSQPVTASIQSSTLAQSTSTKPATSQLTTTGQSQSTMEPTTATSTIPPSTTTPASISTVPTMSTALVTQLSSIGTTSNAATSSAPITSMSIELITSQVTSTATPTALTTGLIPISTSTEADSSTITTEHAMTSTIHSTSQQLTTTAESSTNTPSTPSFITTPATSINPTSIESTASSAVTVGSTMQSSSSSSKIPPVTTVVNTQTSISIGISDPITSASQLASSPIPAVSSSMLTSSSMDTPALSTEEMTSPDSIALTSVPDTVSSTALNTVEMTSPDSTAFQSSPDTVASSSIEPTSSGPATVARPSSLVTSPAPIKTQPTTMVSSSNNPQITTTGSLATTSSQSQSKRLAKLKPTTSDAGGPSINAVTSQSSNEESSSLASSEAFSSSTVVEFLPTTVESGVSTVPLASSEPTDSTQMPISASPESIFASDSINQAMATSSMIELPPPTTVTLQTIPMSDELPTAESILSPSSQISTSAKARIRAKLKPAMTSMSPPPTDSPTSSQVSINQIISTSAAARVRAKLKPTITGTSPATVLPVDFMQMSTSFMTEISTASLYSTPMQNVDEILPTTEEMAIVQSTEAVLDSEISSSEFEQAIFSSESTMEFLPAEISSPAVALQTEISALDIDLPITTTPTIIQMSTIQPNLDLSTLIPDDVISTLAPEISEIPELISTEESVITNIPEVISTPEPVIIIDPTEIPISDPPILSTIAQIIPTLPTITTPELVTVPLTSMELTDESMANYAIPTTLENPDIATTDFLTPPESTETLSFESAPPDELINDETSSASEFSDTDQITLDSISNIESESIPISSPSIAFFTKSSEATLALVKKRAKLKPSTANTSPSTIGMSTESQQNPDEITEIQNPESNSDSEPNLDLAAIATNADFATSQPLAAETNAFSEISNLDASATTQAESIAVDSASTESDPDESAGQFPVPTVIPDEILTSSESPEESDQLAIASMVSEAMPFLSSSDKPGIILRRLKKRPIFTSSEASGHLATTSIDPGTVSFLTSSEEPEIMPDPIPDPLIQVSLSEWETSTVQIIEPFPDTAESARNYSMPEIDETSTAAEMSALPTERISSIDDSGNGLWAESSSDIMSTTMGDDNSDGAKSQSQSLSSDIISTMNDEDNAGGGLGEKTSAIPPENDTSLETSSAPYADDDSGGSGKKPSASEIQILASESFIDTSTEFLTPAVTAEWTTQSDADDAFGSNRVPKTPISIADMAINGSSSEQPISIIDTAREILDAIDYSGSNETENITMESLPPSTVNASDDYGTTTANNSADGYTNATDQADQVTKANPSDQLLAEKLISMGIDPISLNDTLAKSTAITAALPFYLAQLSDDGLDNVSASWETLIQACLYDGRPCDMQGEWKKHRDPQFGNCYTFNYDGVSLNATTHGPNKGLSMLFKANLNDYTCNTESVGFILNIHDPKEMPSPSTNGWYVAPGFLTRFAFQKISIEKLDWPYGNCANSGEDVPWWFYDSTYNPEMCLRSCFQNLVIDKCGCADPRYEKPKSIPYCEPSNKTCVDKIAECEMQLANKSSCGCLEACNSNTYEPGISASALSKASMMAFKKSCGSISCKNDKGKRNVDSVVHVYSAKRSQIVYQEVPLYDLIKFLYDLSNLPGLFFSAGAVFACEFLSLLACVQPGFRMIGRPNMFD